MKCLLFRLLILPQLFVAFSARAEIDDPYRGLENSDDPQTKEWLAKQKATFDDYILSCPDREEIKANVTKMSNFELYSIPVVCGEHYFFTRRLPSEEQPSLFVQEEAKENPRLLLNPQLLYSQAPIALTSFVPSPDGRFIAYGLSESGSDWVTWRVMEVASGENQKDKLKRIKFSSVAWTPDSRGFYYTRLDEDNWFRVYYHALGTNQKSDEIVYHLQTREFYLSAYLSDDFEFLIIEMERGSRGPKSFLYKRLNDKKPEFKTLIPLKEARHSFICNQGEDFYFWTNEKASFGKIISMNLATGLIKEIVPEGSYPIEDVVSVGHSLVISYSKDVCSKLSLFDLKTNSLQDIPLPENGSVVFSHTPFLSLKPYEDLFFSFTNFVQPPAIYRYSLTTHQLQIFIKPFPPINPSEYTIKQVFYQSLDGTDIPLFIVHKKDLSFDRPHPTLLYGYGGFAISVKPSYSSLHMAWMESGGIFALANIRGGLEYGEKWHQAGMLKNKQNCFDDFISAAEWLVANHYTQPSLLAIRGVSNGGLLTAVCMNQRPDLFGAVCVGVGVLDMTRFHLFTHGHFWMNEYGNPEKSKDRKMILGYSPYHNIVQGTKYPATLVTTGDHDDRVVPLHSYKYSAALQAAQGGESTILLRVDTQAGHGAGKSLSKWIDEATDVICFFKKELK